MSLGILKLRLHLPDNFSLKDKRRVVKSLTAQVRGKFNVSIAELDDQDLWQVTTLAIACVSSDSQHVNETLSKIRGFILNNRFDVEVMEQEMEILPGP